MNKYLKKSFALFLITVMLILTAFSSVSAASLLDTSKKVSITLNCTKPGYTFEVFEVAKLTSTSQNTYETSYKALVDDIKDEVKDGDSKAILNKLDNLSELPSGVVSYGTFESNTKTKTFSELEQGIYYVKCTKFPAGVKSVENSVVALPYYGEMVGYMKFLLLTLHSKFRMIRLQLIR